MPSEWAMAKAESVTHGLSGTRTYRIWSGIKRRCLSSRSSSFHNYGGRGITICDEWAESFMSFLAHVGPCPSPTHSIDRTDNNIGYEPGNVRWATRKEQNRNSRHNLVLEYKGETRCLSEWAEFTGYSREMISSRLERGWSVEERRARTIFSFGSSWPSIERSFKSAREDNTGTSCRGTNVK